ncbi:MAG: triose-phosphate isomerase [Acidimicrobiales bacterium]|jgi:triosephosphate isomerase
MTPNVRRPLVSGNWKMNHDHIEALHTVRDLGLRLKPADVENVTVSVHPPFTDLRTVQTLVEGESLPISLGAQHCSDLDSGALTGEVSPVMLARLATSYVIVGHSERRQVFSMTDECVGSTLRAVVRNKMTPICCVGETAEERERGKTEAVIERQLTAAMDGLSSEEIATVVVAYEPIWAIGSGDPASTVDAEDAASFIRSVLVQQSDVSAGERVRVLYGGSVNAENAGEFAAEEDIDGVLVGGASLDAKTFADIVRAVGACYRS